MTYLLIQAGTKALVAGLLAHVLFFLIYSFSFYRGDLAAMGRAIKSSWTIFAYLVFALVFGILVSVHEFNHVLPVTLFVLGTGCLFVLMIKQKNYNEDNAISVQS